jgi:hypothetical protein
MRLSAAMTTAPARLKAATAAVMGLTSLILSSERISVSSRSHQPCFTSSAMARSYFFACSTRHAAGGGAVGRA